MAIIIGTVLCLLSIAVLLYPFLKTPRAGSEAGTSESTWLESDGASPQELESVYQAIRTLQLEHQLGRVPDVSYKNQLDIYRLEAAEILRSRALTPYASPEPWALGESEEADLEQDILLARARIAPAPISAGSVAEDYSHPETFT